MNKKVKLISYTSPFLEGNIGFDESWKPEDLIVYCARVSNPNNQLNRETASRLLQYMIKQKHWSPFEMVDMTVEIKTSRAIAAQILRHRSFSFQEFSQRYAETTTLEPIEYRKQGKTNRQVGDEPFVPEIGEFRDFITGEIKGHPATEIVPLVLKRVVQLYEDLIEAGVAKECARMVLPLCTTTTIYMKGSIRSWIHYLQIRMASDTQKEHRDVALEVYDIFKTLFPNIASQILIS